MNKTAKIFSWIAQIVVAIGFLAIGAFPKLTAQAESIGLFTALGMEPAGRIVIGVLELGVAILLVLPAASATGAVLAMAIMIGAVIAHATVLGFTGPALVFTLLALVFLALSTFVAIVRRKQIAIIGKTL